MRVRVMRGLSVRRHNGCPLRVCHRLIRPGATRGAGESSHEGHTPCTCRVRCTARSNRSRWVGHHGETTGQAENRGTGDPNARVAAPPGEMTVAPTPRRCRGQQVQNRVHRGARGGGSQWRGTAPRRVRRTRRLPPGRHRSCAPEGSGGRRWCPRGRRSSGHWSTSRGPG